MVTRAALTLSPRLRRANLIMRRLLSAQQAAVALRPFFFAVHPDRFARDPTVREKNEKSLQTFNGYLNALYPQSSIQRQAPVRIAFSIMNDETDKLDEIQLELNSSDPAQIVRLALDSLNIDTSNIPSTSIVTPPQTSPWSVSRAETRWHDLSHMSTPPFARQSTKRSHYGPDGDARSLRDILRSKRGEALERRDAYEKTRELLEDEIEYVKRKTGVKEIIWSMTWSTRYMHRCLLNVQQLLDSADRDTQEAIIHALNGHVLLFGRGTFITLSGAIQFGADDVQQAWSNVCRESTVRRFEKQNVLRLIERVSELLGGADIRCDPNANLLQTIHQLQTLIVRLSSRPRSEREQLKSLGVVWQIEIVSGYSALALVADRLQVPCNCDGAALLAFFTGHNQSAALNHAARQKRSLADLADSVARTQRSLLLTSLTHEPDLPTTAILDCLSRLENADDELRDLLMGLKVRLTTSNEASLLNDGTLSLPINSV